MSSEYTQGVKAQYDAKKLWDIGYSSIQELEAERGILASSRDEIYGCVFGRDSIISALKLLKVHEQTKNEYFIGMVRKVLHNLAELQGKEHVLESGEEPGKIIHEYRPTRHEHLTQHASEPWYLYPDNIMRNYDSVDSTPLYLMLMYEYLRVTADAAFIESHIESITAALEWLMTYGDINGDGFIDYRFHPERIQGGLRTQNWMDSAESIFFERSDAHPSYPIAPVEVQAYAYVALRAWSDVLVGRNASLCQELDERARSLKEKFNAVFVLSRGSHVSLAYALDGEGRLLRSARSSMGHCLWAAYKKEGSDPESILDQAYIPGVTQRLLAPDLFVSRAGIRTLSSRSRMFDPISYHNGSIWPHDTAILAGGLENFGYTTEAQRVRQALLSAYEHFKTPIELYGYSRGKFREYETSQGGKACRVQAWSAASLLSTLRAVEAVV